MGRPQIIVTVTAALQHRGDPSITGTAFLVYAGATGPTVPTQVGSAAAAVTAGVPTGVAAWVGDLLTQGAPLVYVIRAVAADVAAVTQPEWALALGALTDDLGPGQVLIPGVSTTAAYSALLAHQAATRRCVLLDGARAASASTLATAATGLAAADGAIGAGLIAPWVTVPAAGGATREVPGSVIAAGLAARGDAAVGHANNAPAGDQGRGAGRVTGGIDTTAKYTTAELDTLNDAGVSVIRVIGGVPTLYGWVSVSSDSRFKQLNWGRMAMQLGVGVRGVVEQFLFRQIDGLGHLYSELEGSLRGYLAPLYDAGALFGATADDAFDVDTRTVNTDATVLAAELHAAVEASLSPHVEKVAIDVTTSVATSVAA